MIYEKQEGVPKFEANEYSDKSQEYVVLIPIINEGERIIKELKEKSFNVQTGIFQADMQISLINDGPVTFMLEREHKG